MSRSVAFPAVKVRQPIGDILIGSIASDLLWQITESDMRDIRKGLDGIYQATGVQRKLNEKRVSEIAAYVKTVDATFPTAVVLAISSDCVHVEGGDERDGNYLINLQVSDDDSSDGGVFAYKRIARVIDGQHRIEGLKRANVKDFYVNIALFVDADIEDQAKIFATVNLTQTKVNKSLVYDLFSYSTTLSPEKFTHDVCISLDRTEGSPFYQRIKRLGTATPGRDKEEPLSQATVVEGILSHIVKSREQLIEDRDIGRRGKKWPTPSFEESRRLVLRTFFVANRDEEMAMLLWNYFEAVRGRWPGAWEVRGAGRILPRTNGFRALMRFFRDAYNHISEPGAIPSSNDFRAIFNRVDLDERVFTTERYPPGTSGETKLYSDLLTALP